MFDLLEVSVEDKDFICISTCLFAKKIQEKRKRKFDYFNFLGNHTYSSLKNMKNMLLLFFRK